jgi:hypothetical protein
LKQNIFRHRTAFSSQETKCRRRKNGKTGKYDRDYQHKKPTGNTLQVGGFTSAAYSRFGTDTTTHVGTISGINDLLISGGLEVNGSAAFDGFVLLNSNASVSGNFEVTGTGSSSFSGSLNVPKGIHAAGNLTSTLQVFSYGTASNSFLGSLNVTKGITGGSYQGGGLADCTGKLLYAAGQFSCGTDDDIPEVGDFGALVGGLAIDNNSGTLDFDPTELINNRTWSDGTTNASIVWTYDLSAGTDPPITFGGNNISFGQTASVASNFEVVGYASTSTWFGNRNSSQSWNFDLSGTDIALKFNNNNFTFSGDAQD